VTSIEIVMDPTSSTLRGLRTGPWVPGLHDESNATCVRTVCVIDVLDQHFEVVESLYPGILVPLLVEGNVEGLFH